jgi:hypothetical protein
LLREYQRDRIELFGEQPDIVSEIEQAVRQFLRFVEATLDDEVIYKPKAAGLSAALVLVSIHKT